MVVIENARVALSRSAIVDDDVLPAPPQNTRVIDLIANGTGKITITAAARFVAPLPKEEAMFLRRWFRQNFRFLESGFLHNRLRRIVPAMAREQRSRAGLLLRVPE